MVTVATLAPGCDSGIRTVPVKGKITYGGGDWPREGMLFFAPVEPAPGTPRRGGMADFDHQGNFVVATFGERDGLVPGDYRVNVQCWEVPPGMNGQPAKSYVPKQYQHGATNGFTLTVPSDAKRTIEVVYDVPKP